MFLSIEFLLLIHIFEQIKPSKHIYNTALFISFRKFVDLDINNWIVQEDID